MFRWLRLCCPAVVPQSTDWLPAPGLLRSLRPAARAAWERNAEGALCFVLIVACCEHGRRFSERRNSNEEGSGSSAHPRVSTLLGLPVSLSAAAELDGGCSLSATVRLLAFKSS